MARSPFQGTYRPNIRPTVVTAPDALVFLNGDTDIIGCPNCKRRFEINKYITSIQVDLSVESVPGTASINLSIPRHSIDTFYFEGTPIITPMMEVEIYMKGHYLVEGLPQYYPVFWGLVTEVGDAYSAGEHTVSISCSDILKWWELCKMNVNPAYTAPTGQAGWSIFGNVMFGKNPYDLIWTLAQNSFGDIVRGSGSLVSMFKESAQAGTFESTMQDLMLYWESRFSRMRSNLLLYGVNGIAVRGSSLTTVARNHKGQFAHFASNAVANANGGPDALQAVFDPSDPAVVAFRTQFMQAGQLNLWQSEYQTKLELANACKEVAGFEFFMDVDGSIVFKPPFYNLDIMSNKPVSWIQDIDIIDWDFSESEAEVVTQIVMQGNYGGNTDYSLPEECTPFTSVTDYHLLRKYGWRSQNYNSEFMGDPQLMFYHGLDILDRINSKRHRGSINIPLRPELRLGFPVYVAPKDQIWYLVGISHNIQFGGRAQTTLTLTAKRTKFIAPKGIGTLSITSVDKKIQPLAKVPAWSTFKYSSRQLSKGASMKLTVSSTGAAQLPPDKKAVQQPGDNNPYAPLILRHPKTGRILGYPNVVMVYKRPFKPAPDQLVTNRGESRDNRNQYVNKENIQKLQATEDAMDSKLSNMNDATVSDAIRERYHVNRYSYGLNSAGVYVYAYNEPNSVAGAIGEVVLLPAKRLTAMSDDEQIKSDFKAQSAMIRPVSDERGFEVVGHFRYGRGISLRDGQLVLNEGKNNQSAHVDAQLAISGDLFGTLEAQAQGLTAVQTIYSNPAATLSSLAPEDLQTAAVLLPGADKPQFVPTGNNDNTNFVDSAPLGSPEQKGVPPSVEASQLSRALTLAEMTVVANTIVQDPNCPCILGREDLAFMNTGFSVDTLSSTTTGDTTSLPATTKVGGSVDMTSPVVGNQFSTSTESVMNKVDQYLFSLYSALDGPHIYLEKALRGDILFGNRIQEGYDPNSVAQVPDPKSALSPPFSAPDRYSVGDPLAAAQQASSALSDLKSKWNQFSSDLKSNAQRTYYTQKLSKDRSDQHRLEADLQRAISSGASPDDIAKIQKQLDEKKQQVSDDVAKLATMG